MANLAYETANFVYPDGSPPEYSDEDLALKFAESFVDDLRFCNELNRWLKWNGHKWCDDRTRHAFNQARAICRQESERVSDNKGLARDIASAKKVAAVERLSRSDLRLAVSAGDFDSNIDQLNTPDGAVNLISGDVDMNRREDLCTKATAVAPAAATPTRWLEFLKQATAGDDNLIAYLQRVAGYCLTGHTSEHALFFLYGPGRNGKGVFLNTVTRILGDYARVAPMDVFTASSSNSHPTELAMLRGSRLVAAQETESNRNWAEARIKALTGGDPISARYMRQDFFTFSPQFKLFFAGNHKPAIRSVDEAMRARIQIVPFTIVVPPEQRDTTLPEKLKEEWPEILHWLIEGALEWREQGLRPPEAVAGATLAYFQEEDLFGEWLSEKASRKNDCEERSATLYQSYVEWMSDGGEKPVTQKAFGREMSRRGYLPYRNSKERGFKGIELTRPDYSEDPRYGS